jgi:hypothetical protein
MNMTGMSTQGGMMGNAMGMGNAGLLGFGNSAAYIPMRPGVDPMRRSANAGPMQTLVRNQMQSMPKGMLMPDPRAMMSTPMGGNQYVSNGPIGAGQSFIAGNMGGLAGMPMGQFSDPMTRKKIF